MRKFIKSSNPNSFNRRLSRFFAMPPVRAKNNSSLKLTNRGSALVMAAIFMVISTTLITVGMKLIANASRAAKERELYIGEAENVARAGLQDAMGWFRRQSGNGGVVFGNQINTYAPGGAAPVINPLYTNVDQAFNPVYNAVNSQGSDTIDASIGIVSEYPLNDAVTANALYWARYEVKKQGVGAFDPNAVHDVTGSRTSSYLNGDGYIWNIVSTGYVYKRLDKSVDAFGLWVIPYNQSPNLLVASARFSTELRKLALNMPIPSTDIGKSAALYVENIRNQVTLQNDQTRLNGAVSAIGTYSA
ncbi:MAG TPA: hypothetical protein VIJ93_03340, partial [bacterium]